MRHDLPTVLSPAVTRVLAGYRSPTTIWEHTTDLTGADLRSVGLGRISPFHLKSTIWRLLQDPAPADIVKPRVLWRLVYLVPVVAGCDCSWRWVSGAQAASCSAGVRIPMAECGRVVLNQWTHSAVATSTASMSSQGPWLRISSALYKELERLGQGKAERNPL